ncbi:ABC transporter substrate-binding protein [Acidisoma silvae]|uniref:ABC transporter substrate-binding protein n=1 Tax=Acidisoma silvae TaxID=2802396 RepID=A0A963YUX7_9PROT|nr:ABC transporter substrate-binding protein [Acidisoma silvae]MCB8877474.1 ABC transporter substrate-binding protein [Acidisoma silvae]
MTSRSGFAAVPQNGGTLRVGVGDFAATDNLNPTLYSTYFQLFLFRQLRNNLIEVGPGGALVPELAESWSGSSDAKTWVFKLRQGVSFHDGRPFTADDAVYSINLHRVKGTTSTAAPILKPVLDIKATGKYELTIVLSSGDVGFPSLMTLETLTMVPNGETDFNKGIGTGGYILESFQPGVKSVVKRNPNYWKQGRAHFDSVEMLAIKDASARTAALMSGSIDACNFVDLKTAHLLERSPRVKLLATAGKAHYAFPMRMDIAPFNDINLRTAMKYAVDREQMVKMIANGYATVGNDQPITPAYQFYDAGLKPKAYDPDKAKFYLKKAGQENFSIELYTSETPFAGATDAAVLYSAQAAKAGINIKVVKTPEDGYWDNIWFKKPFCVARWSGRANENAMISLAYGTAGIAAGWNETHMSDPKLDQMLTAARGEFDEQKRRQLYYDMQTLISDDGGEVIPVVADFVDATSSKVAHGELGSDFDMDGGRFAERWWFA